MYLMEKISKVYDLELKVKVPSGMAEQDLARPVIVINNFEDNTPEYEIYTFGEENVIIPVSDTPTKETGIKKLAEDKIRDIIGRYDANAKIEILSDSRIKIKVSPHVIPSIIGRGGSNINDLEKKLHLHIDVTERTESDPISNFELPFEYSESKSSIVFKVDQNHMGQKADLYVDGEFITSARIGRKGQIKIPKRSPNTHKLLNLASSKNEIQIFVKDF